MKLSEVKGERTLDVIAEIIEPIVRIAQDERVSQGLSSAKGDAGAAAAALVPLIFKEHKEDVVAILASINGMTPEEYADGMTVASVLGDMYEVLTDGELLGFLA